MAATRKALLSLVVLAGAGAAVFWFASAPSMLEASTLATLDGGDAARGEAVFWASGCASCHAQQGATGDERLALGGGMRFETEFGTFVAPNISQHPADGIGMWTAGEFANAVMRGVSPEGSHYYPAFPYASYARMQPGDVADLYAFMTTLPQVEGSAPANDVSFPFSLRRGIGLWKRLYLDDAPMVELADASEQVLRGQYLVEGLGHCGECHTPRTALGGMDRGQWMAGAASLEAGGRPIPNISPSDDGIGGWSEMDIVSLLESGFTPEFDSVGGTMAAVVRNMAELPASDREAIAAYLKAIPARPNGY